MQRQLANKNSRWHTSLAKYNQSQSLYVKITKRDRKIIKGARLLNAMLRQESEEDNDYDEEEVLENGHVYKDIDLFLLSEYHLNVANVKLNRNNLKNGHMRQRTLRQETNIRQPHCTCEKLKKNLRKTNMKYFFTARYFCLI
jgi:hypothetical protein